MRVRPSAALSLLLLGAGCAAGQKFSHDPGSPEVNWSHGEVVTAPAPAAETRDLESNLRQAERQEGDDLAVIDALYELAVARRREGQLDEAAQLYRRALEICESKRGPDHPDVASILNNLAAVEAAQGNYQNARSLLERSVSIRQAALGEDDPLTAQSMSNLALLYAAAGEPELAEPLYRRSLAVLEKNQRLSKGDLEQVLENYAAMLRDTGRDSEAAELEMRAGIIRAGRGVTPE